MKLKTFSKWLVVFGALEVGLKSVAGFDLVGSVLGGFPMLVSFIYLLVLASALWGIYAMMMKKK
ncbi:MAG: DUF378 domain-containing protein [Patescibacteria group bacterium]